MFIAGAASTDLSAASSVDVARVVGDAMRHLGHDVGGRRGHHHDIGLLPQLDVGDVALGGQRERVGVDRPAGERLQRERGHKFGAGTGQDAAHLGAALPEPPDEVEAFVGGDAARDHQQHPLAAERWVGFGSAFVSRLLHADTLRGRRNRRKRVAGAGQGQCTSGGERHQDRLSVAAGLQPKPRAAVVEQVELDVAAAAYELVLALRLGPGLRHAAAHDRRIDIEEGPADILGEGEIGLPVAAVEIVVEDAADTARFVSVGEVEVAIAPRLEARIVGRIVTLAGSPERRVKFLGVALVRVGRREIAAAAEPTTCW